MKKIGLYVISLSMVSLALVPVISLAETSTTTIQTQLNAIIELQKKIEELKKQIASLNTESQTAVSNLITTLKQGDRGENVKTLQALLAADSNIYPDGLITGFFGRLTAEAVKKFQKKHGLDQVGNVGPKTLEKLNKLLYENPLSHEDSNEGKRPCAIVPPGHLIAPGWLKKQNGVNPLVPECQTLPPGIVKKLPPVTTTPDVTAPVISNVTATNIGSTTATFGWTTNEASNSKVYYGTTTPLNLATATAATNASLVTSHSLNLSSLNASTTYYYVVESKDAANNTATSSQQSFLTLL